MIRIGIMAAALMASAAPAQTAEIGADDPRKLHAALVEMGLAPEELSLSGAPSTLIEVRGQRYFVILGGCSETQNCRTVMIGSRFTDVVGAPLAWVNEQNERYDLLKVWNTKDGELGYSVQAPTGGMTRANLRALIDGLIDSAEELGRDATEAKLVVGG